MQEQNNNMRSTRITTNIPAEYEMKGNTGSCRIIDFSESGIGIETNQIFVEGDLLRIKANPNEKLALDIWCMVRNVRGRQYGLEFEEISHKQRDMIQKYVYKVLDDTNKARMEPFHRRF